MSVVLARPGIRSCRLDDKDTCCQKKSSHPKRVSEIESRLRCWNHVEWQVSDCEAKSGGNETLREDEELGGVEMLSYRMPPTRTKYAEPPK